MRALMTLSKTDSSDRPIAEASPLLLWTCGASIAILITNLYFAQSLIMMIATDLGIQPQFAGAVVSASQFGYGLGLFLLVPLSDMVENRRLVIASGALALLGTIGLATASTAAAFLSCAFITGIFSSGAHVLLPYLSHTLPENTKGQILGLIMAGVLMAVMLSRPVSILVASSFGWRAIYILSALITLGLGILLCVVMPQRRPQSRMPYMKTLVSMFTLFAREHELRRRTFYQAVLFAVFTMFWATMPIMLHDSFGLRQIQIALFTLVAIGGVLAAPLAGRWADKNLLRIGTLTACLILAVAFLGSAWAVHVLALMAVAGSAILIDGAVAATQTFSRIVVLGAKPRHRGRVNALYMTIVYSSGALGSIIGVSVYLKFGWIGVALLGSSLALIIAMIIFADRSGSSNN